MRKDHRDLRDEALTRLSTERGTEFLLALARKLTISARSGYLSADGEEPADVARLQRHNDMQILVLDHLAYALGT